MARSKRRAKYTWLPTAQTVIGGEGQSREISGFTGSVGVDGTAPALLIYPLNPVDIPPEQNSWVAGETSLSDVIGSEYIVERIVGKFFASARVAPGGTTELIAGAWVTLGIFVARADDQTPGVPLGADANSDPEEVNQAFNPQNVNTTREPWMFRRSWYLGIADDRGPAGPSGTFYAGPEGVGLRSFPRTTAGYGSIQDGPHIDVKSVRRIRQDERLYACVAIERLPLGFQVIELDEVLVQFHFDYRLLGALRRAQNRSNF